jgi:hypothetical protein
MVAPVVLTTGGAVLSTRKGTESMAKKDDQDMLQSILRTISALSQEVFDLRTDMNVLLEKEIPRPPLLESGTYFATIRDVMFREGRRTAYWQFQLKVEGYPNKYVWHNFGARYKWPLVKLIEQFRIPCNSFTLAGLDKDAHALIGRRVRIEIEPRTYGGHKVDTVKEIEPADLRRS